MRTVLAAALAARRPQLSMSAHSRYPHLCAFLDHCDEDYHAQTVTKEVRAALVSWYQHNRRRLPWRGDAPPYNGSTAGITAGAPAKPSKATTSATARSSSPPQAATAVSAYGVWVSEIMCQQTRVECARRR